MRAEEVLYVSANQTSTETVITPPEGIHGIDGNPGLDQKSRVWAVGEVVRRYPGMQWCVFSDDNVFFVEVGNN